MSRKSVNDEAALDRPFDAKVWTQARKIATQYQIIIEHEDGEWYGRGLELPGAMADGPTPEQCIENTRQAMTAVVASMIEQSQRPPGPARQGMRNQQVNVRLSAEEKLTLETAAQHRGYKGLSDYIRSVALEHSR